MQLRQTLFNCLAFVLLLICLSPAGAQQTCCDSAYFLSRNTTDWKFKTPEEKQRAVNAYQMAVNNGLDELAIRCVLVLALDALNTYQYDEALQYIGKIDQETMSHYDEYSAHIYALYSIIYDELGYKKTAINYNQKSIELYKDLPENYLELIGQEVSQVKLLADQGRFEEAILLGENLLIKVSGFHENTRAGLDIKGGAANNLAYAYTMQGINFRSDMRFVNMKEAGKRAFEIFKTNLEIAEQAGDRQKLVTLLNLASNAILIEEFDTARHYLGQIPFHPQKIALSAIINAMTGKLEQALSEISNASKLVGLIPLAGDTLGRFQLNFPEYWKEQAFQIMALRGIFLDNMGSIYLKYFKEHPDSIIYIQRSLAAFEQALEVSHWLQMNLLGENMNELRIKFLTQNTNAAYCALQLYLLTDHSDYILRDEYWKKVFLFAEQNRSYQLRFGVLNALEGGGWNQSNTDAVYCKDRSLRSALMSAIKQGNSTLEKQQREAYNAFIDSLKNSNNPIEQEYYERRFGQSVPDVTYLQQNLLPDNAVFIEYVWSAPQPFALWATRKSKGLVFLDITMENGDAFWADVETFRNNWLLNDNGQLTPNDITLGHQLYKKILDKVLSGIPLEEKAQLNRLVIAADNVLRTIPFEVLPMKPYREKDGSIPYVLHQYIVNYQYSATLWALQLELMNGKKQDGITTVGALINATDHTLCSTDSLGSLENYAQVELKKIIQKAGLAAEIIPNVTLKDFEQFSKKLDILFFCMHGCLQKDPESSYLSFHEKDSMTVANFYTRTEPFKSRLAVFASCNTAAQEEHIGGIKGEGVVGLHWGISYAGCPNVVATLNPIRDNSSAILLRYFFQNLLLNKLPADQALTQAKRDYLRNQKEFLLPVYWANFICIGPPAKF